MIITDMNMIKTVTRGLAGLVLLLGMSLNGKAQVTIMNADGPGDTYKLLKASLGGEPYEVPDCDHKFGEHVQESFDKKLNAHVFDFYIHRATDTDRCGTHTDRQRNEIKTYGPSAAHLKGTEGETITYSWKFKLDYAFQPSASFTHIFQFKASGGDDDGPPLLTISPRLKGSNEIMALIFSPGQSVYHNLQEVDLAPFKGEWVEVYLQATLNKPAGSLNVVIKRLYDNSVLLSYKNESIIMWRDGADFIRPKWGIYRSLNNASSLRDEKVSFANFILTEGKSSPAPVGKSISLKGTDGQLLTQKDEQTLVMQQEGGQASLFLVEDADDGMVALKATNGRYFSVNKKGGNVIAADSKVKKGNKFEWVDLGNSRVLLRGADGQYMTFDTGSNTLKSTSAIATESSIFSWESASGKASVE